MCVFYPYEEYIMVRRDWWYGNLCPILECAIRTDVEVSVVIHTEIVRGGGSTIPEQERRDRKGGEEISTMGERQGGVIVTHGLYMFDPALCARIARARVCVFVFVLFC